MTSERLNAILAERVMGWCVGPHRWAMIGGRRWLPRWRFQPTTRLEDAFRLLDRLVPEEYTIGTAPNGRFWAKIRVAGVDGEKLMSRQRLAP